MSVTIGVKGWDFQIILKHAEYLLPENCSFGEKHNILIRWWNVEIFSQQLLLSFKF